jgi:radical SAM protein with 4Fe4S-binding SPASM domain
MAGIRLCREHDIKVGLRFTMTEDNAVELPDMLQLMQDEDVNKFYLSHLNYAGRGNRNRDSDVRHAITRGAMDLLFATALEHAQRGDNLEFVTGNNDADGVYLIQWGGNSSGVNIANIDNLGDVHPDTFWWHYSLGNVRQRPFSRIWQDTSDPIMAGLKATPRHIKGRCGSCRYFNVCGGNTRVRALQLTGDPWAEDPACYLTDEEIKPINRHTDETIYSLMKG